MVPIWAETSVSVCAEAARTDVDPPSDADSSAIKEPLKQEEVRRGAAAAPLVHQRRSVLVPVNSFGLSAGD